MLSIASVVLFAGLFATPALAAVDLQATYQQARDNDPAFQKARLQNRANLEVTDQALAAFYPSLVAEGEYNKTKQKLASSENTYYSGGDSDFPTKTYSLSLTQPLFNWGTWVRYQQSKSLVAQADLELEIARQDLIMRCAELYLKALSATDSLSFAKAELAAIELNNRSAEKRYTAGLVPITDLYDSRARLSTLTAKESGAKDTLDDALRGLEQITGKYHAELASLQPQLEFPAPDPASEEEWVKKGREQNTLVLARQATVAVAEREVERQRAGHYPTMDFLYRFNNRDTEGSLFGGGSQIDTTEMVVNLKLPLFQGFYVNSKTREARGIHEASRQDLEKEARAVERLVRSSYQGVMGAIKRIRALETALEAQEMTLKAKKKGFDNGLLTSLAVLDAERDLYYIKLDYANARYDYLLNSLKLKQGAGILQESDIVAINNWLH